MTDIDTINEFTFVCDEQGHTHTHKHKGEAGIPAELVASLLVREGSFITGQLHPSLEAATDDVEMLDVVLVRIVTADKEKHTYIFDPTVALDLAGTMMQWALEVIEQEGERLTNG